MSLATQGLDMFAKRHERQKPSWRDVARQWVGRLCLPWLTDSFHSRLIDDYYIDQEPNSFFKCAVRDELTRRHYESPDSAIRANNRNRFWGSTAGFRWHEARRRRYQDRQLFQDEYLESRGRMLEQIQWLLDHFPFIDNLCEIGTGNGLMVDYLASRFSGVDRCLGIDLNAGQIAENKTAYPNSRVEFLHLEATEYIVHHSRPGTLFVACGTFECFTQVELEEFLALARNTLDPVAIATCDAIDVDFDSKIERQSRPRGNLLYNHNYRYLFEKHGFQTCFYELESPKPIYNRLSMMATSFSCRDRCQFS
jgi:Methyltransferase domain